MKRQNKSFFEVVVEIANLYVILLGIVGLLSTIGFFSIKNKPQVNVLEPIYIFNIDEINSAIYKSNLKGFEFKSLDRNLLCTYGKPVDINTIEGAKYFLPYEINTDKKYSGSSTVSPRTMWYTLGITDTSDIPSSQLTFSHKRKNEEKRLGIALLYLRDFLEHEIKDSLQPGGNLEKNPLDTLYKLYRHDSAIFNEFDIKLFYSTKIYSIISISNVSSEPMENVQFFINDVWQTGTLKVVGWTAASIVENTDMQSANINFNIKRLEAGQSIEFLIKGSKLVRKCDIVLSTPLFSGIRKYLIVIVMLIVLLCVLLFYFISNKLFI